MQEFLTRHRSVFLSLVAFALIFGVRLFPVAQFGRTISWDKGGVEKLSRQVALANGKLDSVAGWNALRSGESLSARWTDVLWLKINGQWDPQFQAISNAAIFSVTVSLLLFLALQGLGLLSALVVALGTIAFFSLFTFWDALPAAEFSPGYFLVLFSALHLVFFLQRERSPVCDVVSALAGICAVISGPTGFLSPIVLLVWMASRSFAGGRWTDYRAAIIVNSVLLLGGIVIAAGAAGSAAEPALIVSDPWRALRWLLVCAPFAALVFSRSENVGGPMARSILRVLAALILAQALVLILVRGQPVSADLRALGIFVSIACVWEICARNFSNARIFVSTLCAAVMLNVLWMESLGNTSEQWSERTEKSTAQSAAIQEYFSTGDREKLDRAFSSAGKVRESLLQILASSEARTVLPPYLRPAVLLKPERSAGFSPGVVQRRDLAGEGSSLPAWRFDHGDAKGGEWVSEPVRSDFYLLQFYLAGDTADGGSSVSLTLQTLKGETIQPLQKPAVASGRWRQINIVTPREPFRVVFHPGASTKWIAFTAPVESGILTRIGKKLAALALEFCMSGILLGGLIVFVARSALLGFFRERNSPDLFARTARLAPRPILGVYVVSLAFHLDVYAGGADSSGYLNLSRVLSGGTITVPVRKIPDLSFAAVGAHAYVPNSFLLVGESRMSPTYPFGLPAAFAAASKLVPFGWAVPVVILAHLVLGVVFTRLLAQRLGLEIGWAWLAALLVGLSPLYVFMGLQPMSDVPSAVWVTAAIWFAVLSRERPSAAIWCGVAASFAVLIRPTNLLCFFPILILLGLSWRRLAGWAIGGAPAAIAQMTYAYVVYGGMFRSGYGDITSLLDRRWLVLSVVHYGKWLPVLLTPLVLIVFVLPFLRGVPKRVRLALVAWILAYAGFYAFYSCTYETWWYLRFLLPAFPAFAIAALLPLQALLTRSKSSGIRASVVTVVAACCVWVVVANVRLHSLDSWKGNLKYKNVAEACERSVPANAVVFSNFGSGSVYYYTKLVVMNYELSSQEKAALLSYVRERGISVWALAMDFESGIQRQIPGEWEIVEVMDGATLWKRR